MLGLVLCCSCLEIFNDIKQVTPHFYLAVSPANYLVSSVWREWRNRNSKNSLGIKVWERLRMVGEGVAARFQMTSSLATFRARLTAILAGEAGSTQ